MSATNKVTGAFQAIWAWCTHHSTLCFEFLAGMLGFAIAEHLESGENQKLIAKERVDVDKQSADVHAEIASVAAEQGAAAAHVAIQQQYAANIASLDKKSQAQAVTLMADPGKLAAFLVQAAAPKGPGAK